MNDSRSIFLSLVIALQLAPGALQAASFDCAKAQSSTEKMICADPELSKADERMAAGYTKTVGIAASLGADDAKELKQDQRDWLKDATQSCKDRACLALAYKKRIAFFDYYAARASAQSSSPTGTYQFSHVVPCASCGPNGDVHSVTQFGTLEVLQSANGIAKFSLNLANTERGVVGEAEGQAPIKNGTLLYSHMEPDVFNCKLTIRFTKTKAVVAQDETCGFGRGASADGVYLKVNESVSSSLQKVGQN